MFFLIRCRKFKKQRSERKTSRDLIPQSDYIWCVVSSLLNGLALTLVFLPRAPMIVQYTTKKTTEKNFEPLA